MNKQKILLLCLLIVSKTFGQTCTCDLVQGLCEVNCCCDTNDCSANDTLTFSSCTETSFNQAIFLCAYDQVVFINNIPQTTTRDESNNLFCVQDDDFAERNFYISPSCISTNSCFASVGPTFSFVPTVSPVSTATFYQSGDKIFIQYFTGVQSDFSLPAPGVSNACQDNVPVKYFTDLSSSCTRVFSDLTLACASENSLNYATYYQDFQILSLPPSLNSSLSLLNITITSCLIDEVEFGSNCTNPISNAANCDNVVTAVSYLLTTDGFNGIVAATVSFTLQQISNVNLPLVQTFSISFQTLETVADQVKGRSGNPGYLEGKPLISAVRGQGTSNVNQNPVAGLEISLVSPDFGGVCDQSKPRLPVLFRNDMRAGCQISVVGSNCSTLQENIKIILDGPTFNGSNDVFVGVFGNTDIQTLQTQSTPSDWVQVIESTYTASPATDTSGCTGMVLSSRFEILYANTGSITNPQAKIIGVRYSYGDPEFLRFQCSRGICNAQNVEIYTSVNFIDISETPVSLLQQNPAFESKFPDSFFSPINGCCINHANVVNLLLSFVVIFLHQV